MLKGMDVRERIEFTFENDKTEPKTVFVLKPLTSMEKTVFMTMEDKLESLKFYLNHSIVEVKNYDTNSVSEALDIIDEESLGEILFELNKLNGFTKDEAKNS